jgi:hypothetical protein
MATLRLKIQQDLKPIAYIGIILSSYFSFPQTSQSVTTEIIITIVITANIKRKKFSINNALN